MDRNLMILLDVINSAIDTLNKNGYRVFDNDIVNEDFYLSNIEYDSERDELVFNCKSIN